MAEQNATSYGHEGQNTINSYFITGCCKKPTTVYKIWVKFVKDTEHLKELTDEGNCFQGDCSQMTSCMGRF